MQSPYLSSWLCSLPTCLTSSLQVCLCCHFRGARLVSIYFLFPPGPLQMLILQF